MQNFTFEQTDISGVLIITCRCFVDERGYFKETYRSQVYEEHLSCDDFKQDNLVYSKKGVLRGMHYQYPHQQDKLISIVKGHIYDVAVDLRKDSPTYGAYVGIHLTEDNQRQLYVPKGCAHGYLTLSDEAIIQYKCTDRYYPKEQYGILYDDPKINIQWPCEDLDYLIINQRDRQFENLSQKEVLL